MCACDSTEAADVIARSAGSANIVKIGQKKIFIPQETSEDASRDTTETIDVTRRSNVPADVVNAWQKQSYIPQEMSEEANRAMTFLYV